jgi:sugar phosphate isomerase/epimerase
MKLGVSMWSYFHAWKAGRLSVADFVREAKRVGVDGVELLDFFYGDRTQIEEIRQETLLALTETGLPVPIFSVSNNFAKIDPKDREAALDRIRFGVDEALLYGAATVRVFAGDVAEGITFEQARGWIVEGLAEAADYAHAQGIRLALENHGSLAGRGVQVRGIVEDVRAKCGHDALGVNPDTGNFLIVNQLSHEGVGQVADLAYMVHFKDFVLAAEDHQGFAYPSLDGRKYVGTAVGEGEVDLVQCLSQLADKGFDGWLSIEFEGEEDPFTAIPRSVAKAKTALATVAHGTLSAS